MVPAVSFQQQIQISGQAFAEAIAELSVRLSCLPSLQLHKESISHTQRMLEQWRCKMERIN